MTNAAIRTAPHEPIPQTPSDATVTAATDVDVADLVGGYRRSRVVLAAVELGVFESTREPRPLTEIERRLGLHPRAARLFLDALVALELIDRSDGDSPADDLYENSQSANRLLVSSSPQFLGDDLIERSRRSYCHWNWLTEALRTGESQVEVGDGYDGAADPDPESCRRGPVFERFATMIDLPEQSWWAVIAVDAALAVTLARAHPTTMGTVVTSPAAAPSVRAHIVLAGLDERVSVAECDVFTDPLPPVGVCVVDALRDYSPIERDRLLGRVRSSLAARGTLVVVDDVIDDERRLNAPALLSALGAVVEGRTCLGYTAAEFDSWCRSAGFTSTEVTPIAGAASAAIAYTAINQEEPS